MALLGLNSGNLMECQKKNIENITKSDSNFAPTFVNDHVLPVINFNGHCLINNIYIPKTVINIYIYIYLTQQLHG